MVGAFEMIVGQKTRRRRHLNISNIEESVSIDPTRPCIYTSNKHTKIHVRIHSTVNVLRACIFIMLSVLKVTQRVPPTCIIKISRTAFVQSIDAGQTGLLANVRVVRVLFTSTALVLGVRALHRLVLARRAFDAVVAVGAVRDGASIFVVRAFWAIRA